MKNNKPSSNKKPSVKQKAEKQIKAKIHKPVNKGAIIELSQKEFKINFNKLQSDVKQAYESMKKLIPESVTEREIKPFGNAAHIILPKEYAYKMAKVIVKK